MSRLLLELVRDLIVQVLLAVPGYRVRGRVRARVGVRVGVWARVRVRGRACCTSGGPS